MTLTEEIVALIQRSVCNKRWLYWPPGPMAGQVFDRKLCEKDVSDLLARLEKRDA